MKGDVTKRDGGTGVEKLRSLTGLGMALNRVATMGSHSHLQEEERKPYRSPMQDGTRQPAGSGSPRRSGAGGNGASRDPCPLP